MNIKLTPFSAKCGAVIREYANPESIERPIEDSGAIIEYIFKGDFGAYQEIAISELIESDLRQRIFRSSIESNSVNESRESNPDETLMPLRFNDKFDFIEPYALGSGGKYSSESWKINSHYENAQFEARVTPLGENPVEYFISIEKIGADTRVRLIRGKEVVAGKVEYFKIK